jgi:ribonuclease Z
MHTIWGDLEPVVRRWPGTVFVLMHFSMRYSDEEVRAFFREREVPGNVVVWVDGVGDEGEGTGGVKATGGGEKDDKGKGGKEGKVKGG